MTIQVHSPQFAKSKATLQDALNSKPKAVRFFDPSIFTNRDEFSGESIRLGESFPVVMDPAKRSRFAIVLRKVDGQFKVS